MNALSGVKARIVFAFVSEELLLEESPKWKILADVLQEVERDDAKNDQCNCGEHLSISVELIVTPNMFMVRSISARSYMTDIPRCTQFGKLMSKMEKLSHKLVSFANDS